MVGALSPDSRSENYALTRDVEYDKYYMILYHILCVPVFEMQWWKFSNL
jgi:hypothetical protein